MEESILINKLIAAAAEVFETMLFMGIEPSAPLGAQPVNQRFECSAFVCLSGQINGLLAIHCRRALVEEITSTLTDSESDAMIIDAWAEVANIVAGSFKAQFAADIEAFELSVPSVIIGQEMRLINRGAKASFPRVIIPFLANDEYAFFVELFYQQKNPTPERAAQ